MRIGWIGAAAVAIAAMAPGVAQAQDGTRTVGEWKLTTPAA
ncbi:hypothetical protein ACFQ1E_11090 [Sphingomonas canadensis]|uniref:Uncharacterized protein n=1 Tax=Sphingomonas canadensis TaxID=1219257 RepID=A0ABW3HC44_9SPHN|nr:hypothetical protein [Sphingomonas canadensis]MCW3836335.1 hypothetical protein [Sphingomonas canadensis]